MRKRNRSKKMSLHRETLRQLEEPSLRHPIGGTDSFGTQCRTDCGSCPASACHPSACTESWCCSWDC